MEKSLDTTAAITTTSSAPPVAPSSFVAVPQTIELSSTLPQSLPVSNPSSVLSSGEILDQAIQIITVDEGFLTEDELLAASMFFTREDAVHAARTFIALGNNRTVQRRFLLQQLNMAALLPGKEGDDHSMSY